MQKNAAKRPRASNSTSKSACDGSSDPLEDVKPRDCDRRVLRSHYRRLKSSIAEDKEDLVRVGSHKFDAMVERVESLHLLVHRPREQIADAEALFDITNAFLDSVKDARRGGGIRPADFVSGILQRFCQGPCREDLVQIDWGGIGLEAVNILNDAPGLCTMLGPMASEPKKRKVPVHKRRDRAATVETARPETVGDEGEGRTETDKNIRTMFDVLRKCGTEGCLLEHLILNRTSFAESVENIFFLSFLVKDGRAEITVHDGNQIVALRNAPSADERSGKRGANGREDPVVNTQFVFRYDYTDWVMMKEMVEMGKELMPKRSQQNASMTPIRKVSRNRGREVTELVHSSTLSDPRNEDEIGIRRAKRNIL